MQAEPGIAEQYAVDGALPVIKLERVSDDEPDASDPVGTIRFVGLPAGYEFSTLIADIVDLSSGTMGLAETTRAELRSLDQDLHLQVFVTPT